ncbi:MAG: methyltransferase family protein [Promethearchaeota archaeon]
MTGHFWDNSRLGLFGHVVFSVLIVVQIVLCFFLYHPQLDWLEILGWVVLWISAIFGVLPIYEMRKRGGVAKGESYMKTTQLVDTGIFAIVRHPQFVAGFLIVFALPLITQSCIIALLAIPGVVYFYVGLIEGDEDGIRKFGEDYEEYMRKVPRANFLLGIIRCLRRRH